MTGNFKILAKAVAPTPSFFKVWIYLGVKTGKLVEGVLLFQKLWGFI